MNNDINKNPKQRICKMYIVRILILVVFIIGINLFMTYFNDNISYARDISFTQEDRDRLITLGEGQKSLQKQLDDLKIDANRQIDTFRAEINKRFENVDRQFSDIKTFMLWGYGILFSMMVSLAGFVLWDRRTSLAPAISRTDDVEVRERKLEAALIEIAVKDAHVKEALQHAGIL